MWVKKDKLMIDSVDENISYNIDTLNTNKTQKLLALQSLLENYNADKLAIEQEIAELQALIDAYNLIE